MPEPKSVTWVAIADGAKALITENTGSRGKPRLAVLGKREIEVPPARDQGSDRPGRFADAGPNQRSAAEATDWHEFAEERFAAEFAAVLNKAAAAGRFDRLVLIAPDRVIGRMRPSLAAGVAERIVAELHKDLTNHPLPEIESQVGEALFPAA